MNNTGFIAVPPSPLDFISGIKGDLAYEVRNESGDWSAYLPSEEAQHSVYFDSKACVTFSALNVIETQLKQLGYNYEFSDRYTAKLSGTTRQGNYLQKVADSIRHDGLVFEEDWPYPRQQRSPVFDWDDYYAEIPQELQNKAKLFYNRFEIKYEWVTLADAQRQLKHAPLQIATAICPGFFQDLTVKKCEGIPVGHATMLYKIDSQGYHIYDSYASFRKVLMPDYPIPFLFKLVVIPKKMLKLIRQTGTPKIYACTETERLWIPSPTAFSVGERLGLWGGWSEVTEGDVAHLREGVLQIDLSE